MHETTLTRNFVLVRVISLIVGSVKTLLKIQEIKLFVTQTPEINETHEARHFIAGFNQHLMTACLQLRRDHLRTLRSHV